MTTQSKARMVSDCLNNGNAGSIPFKSLMLIRGFLCCTVFYVDTRFVTDRSNVLENIPNTLSSHYFKNIRRYLYSKRI
jgi:hypothetical protein